MNDESVPVGFIMLFELSPGGLKSFKKRLKRPEVRRFQLM